MSAIIQFRQEFVHFQRCTMALFQAYNVEFISSTEKFDTSTPTGRAMLNICGVPGRWQTF